MSVGANLQKELTMPSIICAFFARRHTILRAQSRALFLSYLFQCRFADLSYDLVYGSLSKLSILNGAVISYTIIIVPKILHIIALHHSHILFMIMSKPYD